MDLFFSFSEQGAGKCCINHMFQFSQTTFLYWCDHGKLGSKSRRDSKGLIHSYQAVQSIPEPPFSFPAAFSSLRELDDSGSLDGRQTLIHAVLSRGLGWLWSEGGGQRAPSLWHFCTVSRWGKRTLICSMSRVLCAKGTSSLAAIQRLAVSPGPLNKACVVSLGATRERNRLLCAKFLHCILLATVCLGL